MLYTAGLHSFLCMVWNAFDIQCIACVFYTFALKSFYVSFGKHLDEQECFLVLRHHGFNLSFAYPFIKDEFTWVQWQCFTPIDVLALSALVSVPQLHWFLLFSKSLYWSCNMARGLILPSHVPTLSSVITGQV